MRLTLPLHKGRRERPEATAFVFGNRRTSYAALAHRVERLGGGLQALGLRPQDRVGVLAQNSDRYAEALFAIWWAGGVANPINTRWSLDEIAFALDDCDTRLLLVDQAHEERAACLARNGRVRLVRMDDGAPSPGTATWEELLAAPPVLDAGRGGDDLAAILHTGGTTGRPKGVILTHLNLFTNALSTLASTPRPSGLCCLLAAPLFHAGGIGPLLQNAMRLATQVLLPAFTPQAALAAIAAEKVSETFLVPTMLKLLIDDPFVARHDLSSLQLILYGAAPIDGTLLDRAMATLPGVDFAQVYGMTELAPVVAALDPWWHTPQGRIRDKLAAAGRPVPLCEVRIVDGNDQEVPAGTCGEVVVRGANVMAGYWNRPEETAQALRGGWMHTGDVGYLDADGFLFIVDRLKDMIISGGENVYSTEVENVILEMPEISACAVIAVPDPTWGERVHAVIVPRPQANLSAEAVAAYCRTRIAAYKCPRSMEFREALPLSSAGKVMKQELRRPFWQGRTRQVS